MRRLISPLLILMTLLFGHVTNGQELAKADVKTDAPPADEVEAPSAELAALIEQGNKLLGNGDFISALPIWLKALKEAKLEIDI